MAARYTTIGQFPDVRIELRGKLSEILTAPTPNPGTYAAPEDVTGTYLEMGPDGLWTGASVGTLTQGQADALASSGALTSVKVGTPGTVADTIARYGGAALGWVDYDRYGPALVIGGMPLYGAAKLRGSANPPRIAFVTDSTGAGAGAGTGAYGLVGAREGAYPVVLAKALGWQCGSFFGDQNVYAGGSSSTVTLQMYDPRIVLGSFVSDGAAGHFGGRPLICSGASVSDFTFTPESTFDELTFWYPRNSSANTSVIILIDDIVVDTFSQAGANALLSRKISCILGTHTVSVRSTGAGTAYISGIETRDTSNKSPILLHGGYCGLTTSASVSKGTPWFVGSTIPTLTPDLLFYSCTINDIGQSTAEATTLTNHAAMFAIAKEAACDIISNVQWPFNNAAVVTGSLDNQAHLLSIGAIGRNGCFIDFRAKLGSSFAQVASSDVFDNWHLKSSGYAKEIEMIRLLPW